MTEPWQRLKFIDIVDYTKKPRNLNLPTLIPFVPMDLVPLEKTKILECNYVESVSSGTYVEDGDLLLAKITPSFENGKQGILDIGHGFAYATTEVIPLKGKPNVALTDYIALFLKRSEIRGYLAGKMEGSTGRQRLSKSALDDLSVSIPHITEQAKIVFVLNMIQTAIEQQDKLIKTTTKLKKALMQKLFTEGSKGEKQKQTEIGLFPESWNLSKLDSLIEVKGGKRLPKGEKLLDDIGYKPYIRVTDFENNTVDLKGLKFLSKEVHERISRYIINKNDVYISIAGSIGLVGMIPMSLDGANLTENAARLIVKDCKRILPRFLMYFLASHIGQTQALSLASKNAQPKLSLASIKSIYAFIPPLKEQEEMIKTFDLLAEKLKFHSEKKILYTDLFKTLLQELMTGQRRVHEIDFANLEKKVAANG